jgi:hypothetical protein
MIQTLSISATEDSCRKTIAVSTLSSRISNSTLSTNTDTMVEKRLPRPCKKAIDYNVTTLSRLAEGKEPIRPTPPAVRPPRQPRVRNPREKKKSAGTKKPTVTKKPTGTRDKTRTLPTPAAPTPGSGRPASRESSDSEDIIRKTKEGRVEKKMKKEKKDNKEKKVYSDSDDEPMVPPHHNDSDDDSNDEDYHNDAPAAAKEKKKPTKKSSDGKKKETPTKGSKNKKQAEDDDESDEYFSGREGMPTPAATLGMAQNREYALKMAQYLKDREAGKLKGKGKSKKNDEKKGKKE